MTDGVFPVTGALAPLPDYLQVLAPYDGASLVVDDAHGIAVLGDRGRGTLEWYGLWGDQVNRTLPTGGVGLFAGGTLSKAMGGYGGIIPASVDLLRALNSTAHYYDGASAPATPVAGSGPALPAVLTMGVTLALAAVIALLMLSGFFMGIHTRTRRRLRLLYPREIASGAVF